MEHIKRILKIDIPRGQSAFLWGPRKTGKTTYLKMHFPNSIVYDFLKTDLFFSFSKRPSLLREELLAQDPEKLKHPIILDEVQKIPQLLDEVHWLIENKGLKFVLCGSSARKLKRGHSNLLGGRAWRYELFPLVSKEIKDIDLLRCLNHGLIPSHYLQKKEYVKRSLLAYAYDYLKEEVIFEGLTRNVRAFSRFFDAMAYSHGEQTNYTNIARDCGIDAKTVKEYYQILVDTLLGRMVEPLSRRNSRDTITKAAKFYLFDVGVAGILTKRYIAEEKGAEFGKAFEHFIFMELSAYLSYAEADTKINFWRTISGHEVDFILNDGDIAIEVKSKQTITNQDLKGLRAFIKKYTPSKAIIVSNEKSKRTKENIQIIPWQQFLKELWTGQVL